MHCAILLREMHLELRDTHPPKIRKNPEYTYMYVSSYTRKYANSLLFGMILELKNPHV